MEIKEAIYKRHTVRKYIDKPIPEELVTLLNNRVEENNKKYNLNIKLVVGDGHSIMGIFKLLFCKSVNNYFIMTGADSSDLDEKLGYCGADLMLYAQTLGLNTWWVGGMVNKKGVKNQMSGDQTHINSIIAVGYGVSDGVAHKSKKAQDIAIYNGNAPDWFNEGVDALLQAPTALNRQAYKVVGNGNKVSIVCNNTHFAEVDLGIGKYHFEVGAGRENFEWE